MKALCVLMLVLGDLIVLKDGKTIEGVYIGEDDESVCFRSASGQVKSEPKSRIARVERTRTKTNIYEAIASTLTAEEPADYFYLCAWADEQGLEPHVESLCRVALCAEELKGRVLLRLSRRASDRKARGLRRSAVVASPELVGTMRALRSVPEGKSKLPRTFIRTFTGALDFISVGSYSVALARSRAALARLDAAEREGFDALLSRRTRMKIDVYLSRLEALSRAAGEGPVCAHCRGTGVLTCVRCNGKGWKTCRTCGGRGYRTKTIMYPTGRKDQFLECGACRGSGRANCGVCIALEAPIVEDVFIELPRRLEKHDRMPHARSGSAWQFRRTESSTGGGTFTTYSGMSALGVSVRFQRKRSGNRMCPHCASKRKSRARRFTPNELAGLAELKRAWKDELASSDGGWGGQGKLCSFGELYDALHFRTEAATAFYEGKWITLRARRMYLSVGKQPVAQADISEFEEWKAYYKCRLLAEEAIRIPAEPKAWLSLFKLYLETEKTRLTQRYASRQAFCAAFRPGARRASVLSPRGEFVAVAGEKGLVLRPDRPVEAGGAGEVEIWFRVIEARRDPTAVLAVRVLALRRGGKTVAFF